MPKMPASIADVLVVNTCAFIDSAKQESIDTILEMAQHKKGGACTRLIVTGCLAVRYRDELKSQIVAGGMTGKEFVLYDGETRVGSSPKCEITLIKEPAVQPFHFTISAEAAGRRTLTAYEGCPVTVNGAPVTLLHQVV